MTSESKPTHVPLRPSLWLKSLVFHALILLIYFLYEGYWMRQHPTSLTPYGASDRPLTTRLLRPDQLPKSSLQGRREIVDTAKVAPPAATPSKAAEFLGEKTQRVVEQTVVRKFGEADAGKVEKTPAPTAQSLGLGGSGSAMLTNTKKANEGQKAPRDKDRSEKGAVNDEPAGTKAGIRGTHDVIDSSVAIGVETLLNTDEYVYASFFNRLKTEVGSRWEPMVSAYLQSPTTKLSPGTYHTETIFVVGPSGTIEDVLIDKASGVAVFDAAARNSLLHLLRVHNVPKSLVEADGKYRIHLGFIVNLQNSGIRMDYVPDPRFPSGL